MNPTADYSFNMKLKPFLRTIDRQAIVAYTDKSGIIQYVNDNFCEISSGYSRKELIGRDHRIVNSGYHSSEFMTKIWATILNGNAWVGEICNRKKDGSIYWVNTSISPEIIDGEVCGFFAIRYDITKQKELEVENVKLLSLANSVQEIANVGGWELDAESGSCIWTEQTYKIHEVPTSVPITVELGISFYIEEDQPRIQKCVEACIRDGVPFSEEFEIITIKGRRVWVKAIGEPVYNTKGKIDKLRGVFQDISGYKEAEKLAQIEKQKSLHNAKLASIGEMTSTMIHEISNPIAIFDGLIISAGRKKTVEDIKQTLEKAKKPVERLKKMVHNMRQFSRNESTKREVSLVNLREIVEQSLEYMDYRLIHSRIEIRKNLEEVMYFCESSEIEQVVVNLINNAIDAVGDLEEKWVEVSLTGGEGGACHLTVTDSGPGIPLEIAEHIFDSFYTTKERGKGTGIGLGVVSEVLSSHGATIRVNHDCLNTQFVIDFPKLNIIKKVAS